MENPNEKPIEEIRQDLVEAGMHHLIPLLGKDLPLYWTHDFRFLINTQFGYRRTSQKDLAEKVEAIVNALDPELKNIDVYSTALNGTHKRIFDVYEKVHKQHGVPYVDLLKNSIY